ncbi:MAG: CHAT domain-containing protein, partial [Desulfomonilaceae bacterium]
MKPALVKKSSDLLVKARIDVARSDYSGASNYYRKMLDLAEKNRNANNLLASYVGLGTCYEALGDNAEAVKYYELAVKLVEELRSSVERGQRERFFSVKVNGFYRTDPYKGLARVLFKINRIPEALKIAEFTKARVFSEAISNQGAGKNFGVPSDVIKVDQEINEQISALKVSRQRAYQKENQALAISLEPKIKELEKKLTSHIAMLREKYPQFAATRYPQPMDLSQQSLGPNEWAIIYDVSHSGILIFLVKGKEVVRAVFRPIARDELVKLVRKFRDPMEVKSGKDLHDKLASFDFAAGKALSDLLLVEIIKDLPKESSVIIVPDDCLGLLPFEMLVLNEGGRVLFDGQTVHVSGAEFLGDRNQVYYNQSLTSLSLARASTGEKKSVNRLLVIADPVFDVKDQRAQITGDTTIAGVQKDYFESLMVTIEETSKGSFKFNRLSETSLLANDLGDLYAGKTDKLTGLAASKSNLIGPSAKDIGNYRWIVFATHGWFSKDTPGLSEPFLALTMIPPGTDGFLKMSDVASLKITADLVALTACQTGLGKELSG